MSIMGDPTTEYSYIMHGTGKTGRMCKNRPLRKNGDGREGRRKGGRELERGPENE